MKKRRIFLILFFTILFITGCSNDKFDVNKFEISGQTKSLNKGDSIVVDYWNGKEIYYNDELIKDMPIFCWNIEIGDSVFEVLNKLNLRSGYAIINSEVPTPEEDGTTDIVVKKYRNFLSFPFDYLDADLIMLYEKKGSEWVILDYKEIGEILSDDSDTIDRDLIELSIDFNGMDDQLVGEGKVIRIELSRW